MMFRDRFRADEGVTLVELLVVITLLTVVGGIVTSGIVSALRSAAQTNAKIEALNELELASQRVTRDLRQAEGIIVTSTPGESIATLLRNENGDVELVAYVVDGERLIRVDTQQTLVTRIGNPPGEPLFTYLDRQGEVITDCSDAGCDGLAQVGLRLIREVEGLNPVIVETRTSVRNVRYGSIS